MMKWWKNTFKDFKETMDDITDDMDQIQKDVEDMINDENFKYTSTTSTSIFRDKEKEKKLLGLVFSEFERAIVRADFDQDTDEFDEFMEEFRRLKNKINIIFELDK